MGTISVSIDGLEETHDRLRGMKGGWHRAMEGIQNLIDEHDPSITVTATTAIPMDELLRVKATSTAEALFHAPVYLIEAVDPSIIGGIILEALGRRYDASIRAQLSAVHKGLVSGKRGA